MPVAIGLSGKRGRAPMETSFRRTQSAELWAGNVSSSSLPGGPREVAVQGEITATRSHKALMRGWRRQVASLTASSYCTDCTVRDFTPETAAIDRKAGVLQGCVSDGCDGTVLCLFARNHFVPGAETDHTRALQGLVRKGWDTGGEFMRRCARSEISSLLHEVVRPARRRLE